ncbi:MAG: cytochrome c biogenesis protein CcsA [Planctomycetaceae bacterium]|nr:cytochrome c biogenesis protein CcsA [Planctomycetales bacterium]MCB9923428.1 cytochrome c biogenesis protein CcsA [Planctomycetaceae bacterium]
MISLSGMTITCFAACYAIALAVELSRLLFRLQIPLVVPFVASAMGLLAHSLYLIGHAQYELAQRVSSPLSSWYDFCLLAAWVVAGAYMGLMIRRRENAIGVFLLPLVLGLIAVAAFQDQASFPARTANSVWRLVHGLTLMLGTTAVVLGFATGLMYLLQSYRLKHKLPPSRGFRLPSLEWLQKFNRESLFVSTCLLAIGLISGVALNLISKSGTGGQVSWTDPVVLSSGVLFLWLTIVTIFEAIYRPAREGNKVAYLTLASFVFMGLALYFVLFGSHATAGGTAAPTTQNPNAVIPKTSSLPIAAVGRPEGGVV